MDAPAGLRFVSDPPLDRVSRLMRATWDSPSWIYDEPLLDYHLGRQSPPRPFGIGLERAADGALVAYFAIIPLAIDHQGRRRRAAFGSFLTADPSVRGRGVARAVLIACHERARAEGNDLFLAVCEAGAVSQHSISRSLEAFGSHADVVATFRYLAAPAARFKSAAAKTLAVAPYGAEDGDAVGRLLSSREGLPIHRRLDPADFDRRFRGPLARTQVARGPGPGPVRAFLHLVALGAVDGGKEYRNLYLQDLELGDLAPDEQADFVAAALGAAVREGGGDLVFAPDTGYAPADLLRRLGFRMAPRNLHLLAAPLRTEAPLETVAPVAGLCLDIY